MNKLEKIFLILALASLHCSICQSQKYEMAQIDSMILIEGRVIKFFPTSIRSLSGDFLLRYNNRFYELNNKHSISIVPHGFPYFEIYTTDTIFLFKKNWHSLEPNFNIRLDGYRTNSHLSWEAFKHGEITVSIDNNEIVETFEIAKVRINYSKDGYFIMEEFSEPYIPKRILNSLLDNREATPFVLQIDITGADRRVISLDPVVYYVKDEY